MDVLVRSSTDRSEADVFAPTPTLEQLQVAPRLRVQDHVPVGGVRAQACQLRRARSLGSAQVVDYGASGPDRQRQPVASERLQAVHVEVALQRFGRPVQVERVRPNGSHCRGLAHFDSALALHDQQLSRFKPNQLYVQLLCMSLCRRELACGDVRVGYTGRVAIQNNGGQVVVGLPVQQRLFDDRARRDDAYHSSVDQTARLRRIGRLFADGDLVALSDQPGKVRVKRVVGYPCQRNPGACAELSGRQRDLKLARNYSCVIVEGLVEVAHPEQQDGVLVLVLDAQVLSACRGGHDQSIPAPFYASRHRGRKQN